MYNLSHYSPLSVRYETKRYAFWAVSVFLFMLCYCSVFAANQQTHVGRKLLIDTVKDTRGDSFIRVRYTDIVVHITADGWLPQDSALFFSERTKVEWASKILLDQISAEKDTLRKFVDSAGVRINRGMFTQKQVDSTVTRMDNDIQAKIATQEYALKRLDDYRHVYEAVQEILKRKAD